MPPGTRAIVISDRARKGLTREHKPSSRIGVRPFDFLGFPLQPFYGHSTELERKAIITTLLPILSPTIRRCPLISMWFVWTWNRVFLNGNEMGALTKGRIAGYPFFEPCQ